MYMCICIYIYIHIHIYIYTYNYICMYISISHPTASHQIPMTFPFTGDQWSESLELLNELKTQGLKPEARTVCFCIARC